MSYRKLAFLALAAILLIACAAGDAFAFRGRGGGGFRGGGFRGGAVGMHRGGITPWRRRHTRRRIQGRCRPRRSLPWRLLASRRRLRSGSGCRRRCSRRSRGLWRLSVQSVRVLPASTLLLKDGAGARAPSSDRWRQEQQVTTCLRFCLALAYRDRTVTVHQGSLPFSNRRLGGKETET